MLKSVIISGFLAIVATDAVFVVSPRPDDTTEMAMLEVITSPRPAYNLTKIPVEELREVLKQQCEITGHPEVFNNVRYEQAIMLCLTTAVNVTQVYMEMIDPKAEDKAEELSEKYCNLMELRTPSCKLMEEAVKVCVSTRRQNINANMALIQSRMDEYACNNHGEKLKSFIKNGGVTCITAKSQDLYNCARGVNLLELLSLEEEQCKKIDEIQACIEEIVETCKSSVRQELNSLNNYVKEVTSCHKNTKVRPFHQGP